MTVRLAEGTQDELFSGLRSGAFDLALLYDVDMPGEFALTTLSTFAPYVLLPARHRLTRLRKVPLVAVKDEPFVLLDIAPAVSTSPAFWKMPASRRSAFSSPSLEVVRGLVGQGLGYSLLVTRPYGDGPMPVTNLPLGRSRMRWSAASSRLRR